MKKSSAIGPPFRVYEYVADDGTVFWSFTRYPRLISPPMRLVLQDRVGTPVVPYANQLREQGKALALAVPEEESPEPGVE
jgi:hypothetical protein